MFKLNSNKKVLKYNYDLILPKVGKDELEVKSISFTRASKNKLDALRGQYKLSRSAIIRILLDSVVLPEQPQTITARKKR